MPGIIDNFIIYTDYVLETIQRKGKPFILRSMIEKKISRKLDEYPNHGNLKDVLPTMESPAEVYQIPRTEVYCKQPDFWIISDFGAGEASYG